MTTIAVLGGADGSLGTIRAARALGIRTICVDARGDAPGALVADELLNISTSHVDELIGVLAPRRDLAAVVSPASDVNLPTQYAVASSLGLPHGLSEAAVRASVDKGFFRSVCDGLGLPGPGFTQGSPEEVALEAASFTAPVMIKPTDSSGSRGVECVADPLDLEAATLRAAEFSSTGVVIAEEFLVGTHYTAEAIIVDGRTSLLGISRRELTPLPHFITASHLMPAPTVRSAEVAPQIDAVCEALGYRWGALNLDLIQTVDGDIVIVEAGARLGGNGVAELLVLSHGVDATEAYVRMALGERPTIAPRWERTAAMRVLAAPVEGKLTGIEGLDAAREVPGVFDIVVAVQPGERVHPYTRAGAKLGYVLASCCPSQDIDDVFGAVDRELRFVIEEDLP